MLIAQDRVGCIRAHRHVIAHAVLDLGHRLRNRLQLDTRATAVSVSSPAMVTAGVIRVVVSRRRILSRHADYVIDVALALVVSALRLVIEAVSLLVEALALVIEVLAVLVERPRVIGNFDARRVQQAATMVLSGAEQRILPALAVRPASGDIAAEVGNLLGRLAVEPEPAEEIGKA